MLKWRYSKTVGSYPIFEDALLRDVRFWKMALGGGSIMGRRFGYMEIIGFLISLL